MSRFIKEKIVEQYQTRFAGVEDVAVIATQGVDVQRLTRLRRSLRAKGIRAMQVRNRLCGRALSATRLAPLNDLLRGPSTVVWGGESIVDLAKALKEEARTLATMEIRGGVSDGLALTREQMEALATLPSREELIGMAVGRAIGQASRVAALALAAGGRVAAQVREIEKNKKPADAAAPESPPDAETTKAEGTT